MAASVNDKITDVRNAARPVSTTVSSGRSAGGGTLACASLTGWPTASKVHFVTYTIDSSSNPVAGTQLDCRGIVSGNNITSFSVIDGTDTGNAIGDVVEMLPTAAWGQDLADALTAEHSRTGTHAAITTTSINNAGTLTQTGVATFTAVPLLPANTIETADIQTSAVTSDKVATDSQILSYVETGTGQSFATTGPTDATSMTITFTTPASCTKILLRAEATISSDNASSTNTVTITDSSNVIQVGRGIITGQANANALQAISLSRRISVTASTSYTFKMRVTNNTGTTVLNQGNVATSPTCLWAERA